MRTTNRRAFQPRWRRFTLAFGLALIPLSLTWSASASTYVPNAYGALDCNGMSTAQKVIHPANACADVRGILGVDNQNTWGGRFYDNGLYIGHDEPDLSFTSTAAGSGDNVTWTETLGADPKAAPTVSMPGKDVTHWFELSIAPWFSMALCDGNSYPQLQCVPETNANAPGCADSAKCPNKYPGAGDALMEMQFYAPGFAPFRESESCDNSHWCAAMTIDSLECTNQFAQCNKKCEEPQNFAFIQTNGVPTGPPAPQNSDDATYTPNAQTLLMNPGDKISVHMFDASVSGGHAFEVAINDLTTKKSGYMQASAANGFQNTSIVDCSGKPFNFEPEYSSAAASNYSPWTALRTNISTEYEIGHFEPCASVSNLINYGAGGSGDPRYNTCTGPYESGSSEGLETGDGECYPLGDTHGTLATPPNEVAGCLDNWYQNGDLDYDGTPYWADWPTGAKVTSTRPSSFVESPPQTNGHQYQQYQFQTDAALSEPTCNPRSSTTGCVVPEPGSPGKFYPYWSETNNKGACAILFGNVAGGTNLKNFGKDSQYGTNQFASAGFPLLVSKMQKNTCTK